MKSFGSISAAYAPWFNGCVWECPPDRASIAEEWAEIVADMVGEPSDPAMQALQVTCVHLAQGGELRIVCEGAPEGGRFEGGLPPFHLDRSLVVEAVTRMIAVRSRRWNSSERIFDPVRPSWAEDLRGACDPWFAGEISVPIGWADLLGAMALWMSELMGGPGQGLDRCSRVIEEFGGLRVNHSWPRGHAVFDAITATRIISHTVCQACGRPGHVYTTPSPDRLFRTACPEHAPRSLAGGGA